MRVTNEAEARKAEEFIFLSLKPGGVAYNPDIPLANLKDRLAWLSWANLMRPEQPSWVVMEGERMVAGMFGEPVEQTFDIGESEIQTVIFEPGREKKEIVKELLSKMIEFYEKNGAKQIHFWILEEKFKQHKYSLWQQVAMDDFGFAFKGKSRISKWINQPVCKIEKYL